MLPTIAANDDLPAAAVEIAEQPSKTYYLNIDTMEIKGTTDGQEAMKMAIFKALQTERYQFGIYSDNYGSEFAHLIGQPIPYVLAEVQRVITEALLWDSRITAVKNFKFEKNKSKLLVTFSADTIFGEVETVTEVNF